MTERQEDVKILFSSIPGEFVKNRFLHISQLANWIKYGYLHNS